MPDVSGQATLTGQLSSPYEEDPAELTSWVDRALPAPGRALVRASQTVQAALAPVLTVPPALRFGVAGALAAAVTGLVQYLDTRDAVCRETAVHAALNNVALGLYLASWAQRSRGRRPLGRALATNGLGLVSASGCLGGDISLRHGVGVPPQALRDQHRPVSDSSAAPLDTAAAHHT